MEAPEPVIAVSCLAAEARIAAGPGVVVLCGVDPPSLHGRIETAIASKGCGGVISFGVAGGLDPSLSPGDWIVASSVVSPAGRFLVDPTWARALHAALPGAVHAEILGADTPATDPAAKRSLRRQYGTAAIDTESHIAAKVAAQKGIPFAAVRVVLDPARRRLPPAALVPLRPDGNPDLANVLRSIWQTPTQVADLLGLSADALRALFALAAGRRRLGAQLGFPPRATRRHQALARTNLIAACATACDPHD
jgi:hopanoid-associated phosphorylase